MVTPNYRDYLEKSAFYYSTCQRNRTETIHIFKITQVINCFYHDYPENLRSHYSIIYNYVEKA